jgi:hypothetical protein
VVLGPCGKFTAKFFGACEIMEIPKDTVFIRYNSSLMVKMLVDGLLRLGATFIVHPATNQIAMSQEAAKRLGVWVG